MVTDVIFTSAEKNVDRIRGDDTNRIRIISDNGMESTSLSRVEVTAVSINSY